VLTYRLGAEGRLSGARAMAQHVMEVTLPPELAAVAAYYSRTPGVDPTDPAVFGVTHPVVRADINPRVADLLGLDPRRPLTGDQLSQILAGRRADGESIPGRRTRRYDQSLGDVLGLTADRMPSATEIAHIIEGRRADGGELPPSRADALRRRFLFLFGADTDASAKTVVKAIERGRRLDGGPLRSATVLDGLSATRARSAFSDCCFSAPKSLSVAWALAGTDTERALLHAAHRQAVDRTLKIIEGTLGAVRRGKNGRAGTQAGHMAWITCDHYTARPTLAVATRDPETGESFSALTSVPTRGDPQIHSHCLVPALSVVPAGNFLGGDHVGSPDYSAMHGNVHRWGRTYAGYLATALRQIGVSVSLDPKTGTARLDAVPEELCAHFSRRSTQGEAAARDFAVRQGVDWDTLDGRRKVALLKGATQGDARAGKIDDIGDFEAWRSEAAVMGWPSLSVMDLDRPQHLAPRAERLEVAYSAAALLLAAEFESTAVLDGARVSVAAAAGLIAAGIEDADEVDAVSRLILERGISDGEAGVSLISRPVRGPQGKAGTRLTTGGHVEREARLIALAREAAADQSQALTTAEVAAGMRDAGLTVDTEHGQAQLAVANALGLSKFQIGIGVAGSGKTALLSGVVRAWQAKGRRVYGTALAWRQATALQDAGIAPDDTYALAALLARFRAGAIEIDASTVLVVDEVALLSVRDVLALLEIRAQTGCTIAAIGDPAQGQPVQAGGIVGLLQQALGEFPRLGSSVRQREVAERELAALARDGEAATALTILREQGRAHLVPGTVADVAAAAAALWWERRQIRGAAPLTLVPTNADARSVNAAIRTRLQAAGEIGPDVLEVDAASASGERYTMALAIGDSIRLFRRTYATGSRGVVGVNGSLVFVAAIREDGLVLRLPTGREAFVSWDNLRDRASGRLLIGPGNIVTLSTGQGGTADDAITILPRGTSGVRAGGFYVGLSRHREWCAVMIGEGAERREIAQRRGLLDARPIRASDIWAFAAAALSRQDEPETATALLARAHAARENAGHVLRVGAARVASREARRVAPTTLPARARVAALAHGLDKVARLIAQRRADLVAVSGAMMALGEVAASVAADYVASLARRRPKPGGAQDRLTRRR
jgi:conjugative relaxase-like TrwC/TraI family protein